MHDLREEARACLPEADWRFDEPMSRWTTLRVGGPAEALLLAHSVDEILAARALADRCGAPFLIMGNGSNLLVRDGGLPGVTVRLSEGFARLEWFEDGVSATAGVSLPRLARAAIERGLDGLTWAGGIPGTLGGGLTMNAGAYGGCLADVVVSVAALDPAGHTNLYAREACAFSYRHSVFQESGDVILSARLELAPGDPVELAARAAEHARARAEKQPLNLPSAGSFFKRPEGDYAARLIDAAGLRGARVGDAAVSEKHTGFIVNLGSATAGDIMHLMEYIQQKTLDLSGLKLKPEVSIVGIE